MVAFATATKWMNQRLCFNVTHTIFSWRLQPFFFSLPLEQEGEEQSKRCPQEESASETSASKNVASSNFDSEIGTGSTVSSSELSQDDILLGRGVPIQRHPGNIRMHHLVKSYRKRYQAATRAKKAAIIQEVLQKLKCNGARFLKLEANSDLWEVAKGQAEYDKISHGLCYALTRSRCSNSKNVYTHMLHWLFP
jgi:hypothetical protein